MKLIRLGSGLLFGLGAQMLVVVLLPAVAEARPQRVSQVPNGSVNGCATCHISAAGGGPRNSFGITVETSFLSVPGSTGVVLWGPALAAIDSDSDGRTNGNELLDPTGAWTIGSGNPGLPAAVSNPGTSQIPVPALGILGSGVLASALLTAAARIKRRAAL